MKPSKKLKKRVEKAVKKLKKDVDTSRRNTSQGSLGAK